jgi:tetratricopeptide (TPR) repeat protein
MTSISPFPPTFYSAAQLPMAHLSAMKIALVEARKRWLFFAALLLLSGALSFEAGKVWLATHWAASPRSADWFRAAKLEPRNAEYWHQLGQFEQWDIERDDFQNALHYYERAVELNPRSAVDWMDLASAYETLGQTSRAQHAYQQAKLDHPVSPEVAWRYASFLLRQNDPAKAFAEFRFALTSDPKLGPSAIAQCWKAGATASQIVSQVLPAESRHYLAALDFFLAQQQEPAALEVWDRLLDLKQPFETQRALPLVNHLIAEDRAGEGQHVWQQALTATNWPADPTSATSAVFNGGFEHDVLNGGFDWQLQPVQGASFYIDTELPHTGMRSLRISFDGSQNLNFSQVLQWVPVEPRSRYRFAAFLRTDGISTDSGVRFLIHDLNHPGIPDTLTPDLTGTHPWSLVSAELTTGPETHLLSIALRRLPSRKLDNKIKGRLWLDDVSLTLTSPANEPKTTIP